MCENIDAKLADLSAQGIGRGARAKFRAYLIACVLRTPFTIIHHSQVWRSGEENAIREKLNTFLNQCPFTICDTTYEHILQIWQRQDVKTREAEHSAAREWLDEAVPSQPQMESSVGPCRPAAVGPSGS